MVDLIRNLSAIQNYRNHKMDHPYTKEYYDRYGFEKDGTYDTTPEIRQTLEDLADRLCGSPYMFYTHLDIGCAFGYLVEQMQYNGVRSQGVDISEYAISQANPRVQGVLSVMDITKKPIYGSYDLVTCIEVIEHIDPSLEERAIYNMCLPARKYLYFSSDYNLLEPTHVNVKYRHEWIGIIEKQGFRTVRFENPVPLYHGILFERR